MHLNRVIFCQPIAIKVAIFDIFHSVLVKILTFYLYTEEEVSFYPQQGYEKKIKLVIKNRSIPPILYLVAWVSDK